LPSAPQPTSKAIPHPANLLRRRLEILIDCKLGDELLLDIFTLFCPLGGDPGIRQTSNYYQRLPISPPFADAAKLV
jgi:hypothetical protein